MPAPDTALAELSDTRRATASDLIGVAVARAVCAMSGLVSAQQVFALPDRVLA